MPQNIQTLSPDIQELYRAAKAVRENAYVPYSHAQVGAAMRTTDGRLFTGCNVENVTYGATMCAERVALCKAVSEVGRPDVAELLVVTDATPPWPPCGICRQIIAEFNPTCTVHLSTLDGEVTTMNLTDLFPNAFGREHHQK